MNLLNHNSSSVVIAACYCLGQIGRRNDLPLANRNLKDPVKYGGFDGLSPANENNDKIKEMVPKKDSKDEQSSSLTKLKIVERLLDLLIEKNTPYKVNKF